MRLTSGTGFVGGLVRSGGEVGDVQRRDWVGGPGYLLLVSVAASTCSSGDEQVSSGAGL